MKKGLIFGGVVLALGGVAYFLYRKHNARKKEALVVKKISANVKQIIEAKRKK